MSCMCKQHTASGRKVGKSFRQKKGYEHQAEGWVSASGRRVGASKTTQVQKLSLTDSSCYAAATINNQATDRRELNLMTSPSCEEMPDD